MDRARLNWRRRAPAIAVSQHPECAGSTRWTIRWPVETNLLECPISGVKALKATAVWTGLHSLKAAGGPKRAPKTAQNHQKRGLTAPFPRRAPVGSAVPVHRRNPLGQCVGFLFVVFCPFPAFCLNCVCWPSLGPFGPRLRPVVRNRKLAVSRARQPESRFQGHFYHVLPLPFGDFRPSKWPKYTAIRGFCPPGVRLPTFWGALARACVPTTTGPKRVPNRSSDFFQKRSWTTRGACRCGFSL